MKKIFILFVFMCTNSVAKEGITANDILQKQYDRNNFGFTYYSRETHLLNIDKHENIKKYKLSIYTAEGKSKDRNLVVVEAPDEVKGLKILSIPEEYDSEGQWMYLPDLNITTAVKTGMKAASFLGSEFSYEDLSLTYYQNFTNTIEGVENYLGMDCYLISAKPKHSESSYGLIKYWIDKKHLLNRKIEYYTKSGTHIKTMRIEDWNYFGLTFAVATDMYMENHITKNRSELHLWNVQKKSEVPDGLFDMAKLAGNE